MSTTWHENYSFLWIFKGRRRRTGRSKTCCALPAIRPPLRINQFQGDKLLRRKENSSQGPRRRLHIQLRCREESISRFRNLNRIPFRWWPEKIRRFETELPHLLGSTNPRPTAVDVEPFPTSVFKDLFFNDTATTEIYTRGRSTQHHCKGFVTDLHACLLVRASYQP